MVFWFLTRNGRFFTHFSIGLATASVFATPIVFHGPLLHKYQKIVEMYQSGEPKPLDPSILTRAEKVLSECDIDEVQKKAIRFFNVNGSDIVHAGGRNFPWGAIIGIPFTFDRKISNLKSLRIVGMDDSCDWLYDAPELLDTFQLPVEAQKFAIAREIYSANIYRVIEDASLASFFLILFPAEIIRKTNGKYKTYKLPLIQRLCMYVGFYVLGFCAYRCFKDPTKHLYDRKCDENAAKLGPEYLAGGIEFYENILIRNKHMRQLFGKKGESMYTKDGDTNYILFAPKLSILKRLELLKKLQNEKQ